MTPTTRQQTSISRRAIPQALFLGALLLLAAFGCQQKAANENTNSFNSNTSSPTNVVTNPGVNLAVNQVPQRTTTEDELRRLASSFAERYGSYSNQTDYANLESLLVFMSSAFENQTKAFIKDERAKQRDTSIYYGITTRSTSIQTRTVLETQGVASFLVTSFRKETIGSAGNVETFQEDLLLDLKRESGAWKIDRATWQGRR